MANYIVSGSKFRPFSYAEMLQPIQSATVAHQELENQYGELATKASVWEEMANEQTDPYAYKMYKTYANDLEEQAGQLAREGLNAASRRDMLNMRARYSKEITPIEQAYTARQKQAEEQQKALLQDPTLMLSRRAATTSLDDYIRNPQLAYESYSGKLITAQAASAASALAKEMQEKPRKWRSILGNSYYETMMQKGFSSQAVLQAIQDNPNAAPQLTRIVEDAINSSDVRNWGDQATIARAIDYAKQGLWSAVGETQYQTLDNWRAKLAAQEAMQKRVARAKAGLENSSTLNYKPRTLSHLDAQGNVAAMKRASDNLHVRGEKGLKASYFGKDGNINPMRVYEEYQKLMRPSGTELYQASKGVHMSQKEKENMALESLRKKYGSNIKVISGEEYDALRMSGYNNKSTFKDFSNLDYNIDNTIKSYTEWFINGDPSYLSEVLNNNIAYMNKADKSFTNAATVLDEDFNTTSKKFDPDDYGTDKNPIVDFSHSTKHRNKIIVTYKDGTKVAYDPNLISGEAYNLFNAYEARRQEMINEGYTEKEADNYLEPYLMQGITNLGLRGHNQSTPKTNSKLEQE
nr:MAG TPA: hypothetical protein [Crassvirales sp.]